MLRFAVFSLLLAAVVRAQTDCNVDGPFLGDVCSEHADCNQGECAIVHGKCSDSGSCACTLGYWGENSTRACDVYALGDACTSDDQCQASVPNSECSDPGGACACAAGFFQESTRIGHLYCANIVHGTACVAGADGDTFCAAGDTGGTMTCSENNVCSCPADQVFNHQDNTCYPKSEDPSCAACQNTGGICYDDAGTITCACPSTKYSSTGDALTTGCDRGSAAVGNICQDDGTVTCADTNAECVHFGTMTKRYVCQCATGFIRGPQFGSPGEDICHEELSTRQDPNCADCNLNEGRCYDMDGDDVHDICKCPTSRSTSDPDDFSSYCDTSHVNVTCDSDSMTVCYTPHNTDEFPDIASALDSGESLLFVKDKIHDKNCYLTSTSAGWCIDLEYGTFLSCDTMKNDLNEHTVSYTNWIILQRQPEKRTVNDMYMYTYCSYDSMVNAFTGHVAVEIGEPPAVAAEGSMIQAGVNLAILDEFGNDASTSGVILGQRVQLLANITDDQGVFQEIKAEVCLASNLPDLASPFARTTLMMYDGCPEVNTLLDEELIFTEDLGNPKVARSNMFSMFKFDDSEYVFFHCALRVCMDGNLQECDPSVCARKKRSISTGLVKRSSFLEQKKLSNAMRKLDNPDFTVSVSAVKIKRSVNPNQIDYDSSYYGQPRNRAMPGFGRGGWNQRTGRSSEDGGLTTTQTVMIGGGLFCVVVLTILVVVIVVVLKKPRSGATHTEAQQNTHL